MSLDTHILSPGDDLLVRNHETNHCGPLVISDWVT